MDSGDVAEVLAYRPLTLHGVSPVISVEDAGWQGVLLEGPHAQYDVGFNLVLRVNREAHGAEAAQDIFDTVRRQMLLMLRPQELRPVNFEALQFLPGGTVALTYFEIIDGQQYVVSELPVLAIYADCSAII